eukprot:2624399-Rhodomonas_salina.2
MRGETQGGADMKEASRLSTWYRNGTWREDWYATSYVCATRRRVCVETGLTGRIWVPGRREWGSRAMRYAAATRPGTPTI